MEIKDAAKLKEFAERFRVQPGRQVELKKHYDPADTAGMEKPDDMDALLERAVEFMAEYQDRLYAESKRGLLIMLQAMDAAGKDGVIKHVMSGLNPQGCQVYSFKAPSAEELDHDYMWRNFKALPERGRIGIFNRSYYEEALVVRVHPNLLAAQSLPPELIDDGIWKRRFREINNFEQYLVDNGIEVVKIFLNVSKEEQRQRLLARIETPEKQWKVSAGDAKERQYWDKYQECFNDIFTHTSTERAPWYVVPADHKWFSRIVTAAIVASKLMEMDPQYPTVTEAMRAEIAEARRILESEPDAPQAAKAGSNGDVKAAKKSKKDKGGKHSHGKHANGEGENDSLRVTAVALSTGDLAPVAVPAGEDRADATALGDNVQGGEKAAKAEKKKKKDKKEKA
jgi:PPK2 family polyphosphate:nucleotide phosphotransferase